MPVPAARGRGERARRGDPERGVRDPVSLLLRTGEPGGLAGARGTGRLSRLPGRFGRLLLGSDSEDAASSCLLKLRDKAVKREDTSQVLQPRWQMVTGSAKSTYANRRMPFVSGHPSSPPFL